MAEKAKEFLDLLQSEKLQNQRPDGPYIIKAMNKAAIDSDNIVRWSEMCFCPTPLAHERKTIYDEYFTEFNTKIINNVSIKRFAIAELLNNKK